jgi:small subunit ribosomal protein S9
MATAAKKSLAHTVGRRKSAVARAYLREGSGKILVNRRPFEEYFGRETLRMIVMQPLRAVKEAEKYDVLINVKGGGPSGQAGASRHAIARGLASLSDDHRSTLKPLKLLRRDARAVERKKYGRHKARKRPQFSKR